MATVALDADLELEPIQDDSDLGLEPIAAPPTPLQALAPMTAAAVDDGIIRRRKNESLVATTPSFIGGGRSVAAPTFGQTQREREQNAIQAGANLVRYGAPAAAALAFPPAAGIPALLGTAAMTGGAGVLGGAGAQVIEKQTGLREEYNPGQVAFEGVTSATPLAPARSLSGPWASLFTSAGKQAVVNQASYIAGSVAEKAINEGRFHTTEEITAAVTDPANWVPGGIGAVVGGVSGFASRPARQLTAEQKIAQEGAAARQSLEAATGQPAPLTGTQQTGKNIPGEFTATSGEVAAQQAVPANVRNAIGEPSIPNPSLAAEAELAAAGDVAAQRLGKQVGRTVGKAEGAIESSLQTSMPGAARANSVQESAQVAQGSIRNADQRLKEGVDLAFEEARSKAAAAAAGKPPEALMEYPRNAGREVQKVLSTLAVKEVTDPATGVVTRIPSQFYDEATKVARGIMEVADSPQTLEQITGLRQAVGELMDQGTQIAPGLGKKQLAGLYDALAKDEANAAAKYGPDVAKAFETARATAKNRFDLLQDNPGILKLLKDPSEKGAFQNPEQIYEALTKQPNLLESVKKIVTPDDFKQIRRGLFDSLRHPQPVEIAGQTFENAGSLANNYRNLPQSARVEIAGDAARANQLQSILDDANRVQNAGRKIPISGGIKAQTLDEIANTAGQIDSRKLRNLVIRDATLAKNNAQKYFNDTVKEVRNRTLNPDIAPDQFVRDFVLKSNNVQVVDEALSQLKPSTAAEVRKQAARVFLDAAIEQSGSATSLEKLAGDKNRLEIARRIIDPGDFKLIDDFIKWSQAKNLTASGGKLEPNKLATVVWRVTKARFLIDSVVGNAGAQDFMSSVSRAPDWLAKVKPNMTLQDATSLANASKIPLNGMLDQWRRYRAESEKAKASLPESKQMSFEEVLGVPEPPK